MRFWGRGRDSVEVALRAARPVADDELVDGLAARVAASNAPRTRTNRGSRLAFGAAVTVFMLGTFASFGGLGYAATNAADGKATAAKSQSAASAQYDEEKVPTVGESSAATPTLTPPKSSPTVSVAGESTAPKSSGTLPFTGLGLGATALLGSMLLVFGVFLRRREEARE
jgi:hypothetical protein